MANFMYNVSRGRTHQFTRNILDNDPATSGFIIVVINTTETDGALQDLNDLAAVLANANTAEVTNTNYARKTLDDVGDGITVTIDDTNNRVDVDFDDQTFSAIAAGDAWTDVVVCYAPDTAGADSTLIPISQHDFAVTPDGSDINLQVDTSGFYRAQ